MRIGLALALAAFTSGCAFSNTPVKLAFSPPAIEMPAPVDTPIVVEPLKDQRGGDPLVLGNKGVTYKTSGQYTVDTPVATIVTNAIRDTLASLKYRVEGEGGELALSGELLRLDSQPIMGFWSGQLECTIQVSLKLTGLPERDVLWAETFTAYHKKSGLQIDHEGHHKDVTEAALAELTRQIATSPSLRAALEKFAAK